MFAIAWNSVSEMIDSLVFKCSNLHILSTPMHISDNFDDRTHNIKLCNIFNSSVADKFIAVAWIVLKIQMFHGFQFADSILVFATWISSPIS